MIFFQKLAQWKNMNSEIEVAGPADVCYQDSKPFTLQNIHQHVSLYILRGISTSPQVEIKLKQQHVYKVHVDDFI